MQELYRIKLPQKSSLIFFLKYFTLFLQGLKNKRTFAALLQSDSLIIRVIHLFTFHFSSRRMSKNSCKSLVIKSLYTVFIFLNYF